MMHLRLLFKWEELQGILQRLRKNLTPLVYYQTRTGHHQIITSSQNALPYGMGLQILIQAWFFVELPNLE